MYAYILKYFENLKHFSIVITNLYYYPSLVLRDLPLTTFFSSILNKLCIRVGSFEECLALLDGRLKQLTTMLIHIINMEYHPSNVYNMVSLDRFIINYFVRMS